MDLKSLLNQALKSDLIKQGADALGKQSSNIKSSSNSSQLKPLAPVRSAAALSAC